jgi:hypothetical protein
MAQIERALGNAPAALRAVQDMKAAFEQLSDDDKAWCRPSLEKLARLAPAVGGEPSGGRADQRSQASRI